MTGRQKLRARRAARQRALAARQAPDVLAGRLSFEAAVRRLMRVGVTS